jgi:hypothetical protein
MKIGIIYCGYNCLSYIKESLYPFVDAKDQGLISQICTVSIPFMEYFDINKNNDGTTELLLDFYNKGFINHIFTNPSYIQEHKARDLCLQYLKIMNCDIIWMVDADEFYSLEEIKSIINFINENPNYCWYSINFKNYIFDGKQWIDGFCPPRIFKNKFDSMIINSFFWDNDIAYEKNNEFINYKNLLSLEVPKQIAHIKHLTWLHQNGKSKYEYQMKHFGHCGYKWNYETNLLEINEQFYLKTKQAIPIIYHE